MKKSALILLLFWTAASALAFDQVPIPWDDTVLKAEIIGIGEITGIKVSEERCETNTKVFIAPKEFIKGATELKELRFSYTVYEWKKAFWPWESDCPSVGYTFPAVADGMKQGQRVIFTARYFPEYKETYVTSTARLDRLEELNRILSKK